MILPSLVSDQESNLCRELVLAPQIAKNRVRLIPISICNDWHYLKPCTLHLFKLLAPVPWSLLLIGRCTTSTEDMVLTEIN